MRGAGRMTYEHAMDSLGGKTAVVTGAASGMGKAFAARLARAGMNVVLADVEVPPLEAAVEEVRALGVEAIGLQTDVSDAAAVDRLRDGAIERFGRVNVLCNNAGVAGRMVGLESGLEIPDWQWVLGVNLWGVIHGHRSFLPHFLEHGDAHVVNTASMAGLFPGHSAYSASKWAVVGITEGLYNQLQMMGSSVGVSCLCPGFVATNIAQSDRNRPEWAAPLPLAGDADPNPVIRQVMVERIASGRPPAEVADLVHDAIVGNRFWIFTDGAMVASLEPRFQAILAGDNPPPPSLV